MLHPTRIEPDLKIADRVLPKPLLKAIYHIFDQKIADTALVGGTALSGFYAGHRRSDDIDLFTKSSTSFDAAVLAVESLKKIGATLSNQSRSNQYYRSLCNFENHTFTIDIVLDENLFRIGTFQKVENITVVELTTLFKMKAATLVSRCSEKDLYDLLWLFDHPIHETTNIENLIHSALKIDPGATAESILLSLSGSNLSEKSCNFAIHETTGSAFQKIIRFRKQLIIAIKDFDKNKKNTPLKEVVNFLVKSK